jgi:hypothetical protein
MTFGNQFGLALYDPEKRGVTRSRKKSVGAVPETWPLFDENGAAQMEFSSAGEFCGALKKALKNAQSTGWLNAIWSHNQTTIEKVRANCPELVGSDQTHFSEFLQRIYDRCAQELATPAQASEKPVGPLPSPATNPRRIRDNEHLRRVALLPCIVCDRQPSQAHHIRFAQPRALGRKSSDEFVVPLCNLHHRSLHDAGNEENWWKDFRIDPLREAQALWERHKNT